MSAYRLIASDIDGTLLPYGDRELDPAVFEEIRRLKEKGILFMAASGREYSNLRRLFAPVADDIVYLCLNGCLTIADNKVVSREIMNPADAVDLIHTFTACPRAEVVVSGEKTCYMHPKDPAYLHLVRDVVGNDVTVVEDLTNIPEPFSKISAYEKDGDPDLPEWKARFGSRLTIQLGGGGWIDCTPKNVNKAAGFRRLLAALGIDPKDTIMFGDNENDSAILAAAGTAAAVRTAMPAILAQCDVVVASVSRALADILAGKPLERIRP
jgi:Cof subfamily protein (haloacid dehalogenase superfamily)